MRVKSDYILREVAEQCVVVPVGKQALNFNGIITLNNSGKLLWNAMTKEISKEELVNILVKEYDVSKEVAAKDVTEFIYILKTNNLLEDDKE